MRKKAITLLGLALLLATPLRIKAAQAERACPNPHGPVQAQR